MSEAHPSECPRCNASAVEAYLYPFRLAVISLVLGCRWFCSPVGIGGPAPNAIIRGGNESHALLCLQAFARGGTSLGFGDDSSAHHSEQRLAARLGACSFRHSTA